MGSSSWLGPTGLVGNSSRRRSPPSIRPRSWGWCSTATTVPGAGTTATATTRRRGRGAGCRKHASNPRTKSRGVDFVCSADGSLRGPAPARVGRPRTGRRPRDEGARAPPRLAANDITRPGPRPAGLGPSVHLSPRLTVSVLRLPRDPLATPSPDDEAEPGRDDDDGEQTEPSLDLVHVSHHFLQLVRE